VAFLNVSELMNGSLPAQCEAARSDPDTIRGLSGQILAGLYHWSIHETACLTRARLCTQRAQRARVVNVWASPVLQQSALHRRRYTTACKPLSAAALSLPRLSAREATMGA